MASANLPETARANVATVRRLEADLRRRHSGIHRVSYFVTRFFGSVGFIAFHVLFLCTWILWNLPVRSDVEPFDPYPFPLLSLVVSVEFLLLTTFVLMNQRLLSQRQDQWAHLNLQVCLLAEQETTKNVQMLRSLCKHFGIHGPAEDEEIRDMAQQTPLTSLAEAAIHAAGHSENSPN